MITVTTVCTTEPSESVVADVSTSVEGGGVLCTRTDVVSGAIGDWADVCDAGELPPPLVHGANKV